MYESTTHWENKAAFTECPITDKVVNNKEGLLKTTSPLHMLLSNRRQCPKTNDNLAEEAVLLQHNLTFLTLNIYKTHSDYNTQ